MEPQRHNRESELKGFIFRHIKRLERLHSKFGKCLYPIEPACTAKPCKAHSIQNRVVLDSLAEDRHVVVPKLDVSDVHSPPGSSFSASDRTSLLSSRGFAHDMIPSSSPL
jgi:hypothetical protein